MKTIIIFFVCLMLACPLIAAAFNCILRSRAMEAARLAGYCIGFGSLIGLGLLSYVSVSQPLIPAFFIGFNACTLLLCNLVLLVSFIVHRFSLRYMHGDRLYRPFFLRLSLLTFTALLMVSADNMLLFWASWSLSNVLLVALMVHKKEWSASKHAGILAFYTLASGSFCLLMAFVLLHAMIPTYSIEVVTQEIKMEHSALFSLSMGLVMVSALIQSGLFPFHRWLISSLNSPTPVSALMHAGLINGGGILLVKFAPLMIGSGNLLTVLFITGSISALLGSVWKLMQHDIKKMLACSTMAQMGFMMMQCGVGLFAAAIAHLCWHGLFKAYLFLSSGSAVKQKKSEALSVSTSPAILMTCLAGGLVAMISFAIVSNKPISLHDANGFVLFFAFIAGAQLMLTWLNGHKTILSLVSGLVAASFLGLIYGASIYLIQWLIPGLSTLKAPQLSWIHWIIMSLFFVLWAAFNLGLHKKMGQSKLGCRLYMSLLNSSQPARKTVTALRNDYNYQGH